MPSLHTALAFVAVAVLVLSAPPVHARSSSTKTKAGCSCQDEYVLGEISAKHTGQCGHDGNQIDTPLKCKQKDDGGASRVRARGQLAVVVVACRTGGLG